MINKLENFIIKIIVTLNSVLLLSFAFSSNQICMAQRMLPDRTIEFRNELFQELGIKKQFQHYKEFRLNDSTLKVDRFSTLHFDPNGYLIEKESSSSKFSKPSSVFEYRRDKNGNVIEIIWNGKLVESKTYNDSNKITIWNYYETDTLFNSWIFNYDSLGNQIEQLIKYPNGRIDTDFVYKYEYDYSFTQPLKKSIIDLNTGEKYFLNYDSLGRVTKKTHFNSDGIKSDSSFHFYNDKNNTDSIIEYEDGNILKNITRYDDQQRPLLSIVYNELDSMTYQFVSVYNDDKSSILDSTSTKGKIVAHIQQFDENGNKILEKMSENGEALNETNWKYFPNRLLRKYKRIDYKNNKIEETTYEYEFY